MRIGRSPLLALWVLVLVGIVGCTSGEDSVASNPAANTPPVNNSAVNISGSWLGILDAGNEKIAEFVIIQDGRSIRGRFLPLGMLSAYAGASDLTGTIDGATVRMNVMAGSFPLVFDATVDSTGNNMNGIMSGFYGDSLGWHATRK